MRTFKLQFHTVHESAHKKKISHQEEKKKKKVVVVSTLFGL